MTLSAADPLNLVGILVPGETSARDFRQDGQLPGWNCGFGGRSTQSSQAAG